MFPPSTVHCRWWGWHGWVSRLWRWSLSKGPAALSAYTTLQVTSAPCCYPCSIMPLLMQPLPMFLLLLQLCYLQHTERLLALRRCCSHCCCCCAAAGVACGVNSQPVTCIHKAFAPCGCIITRSCSFVTVSTLLSFVWVFGTAWLHHHTLYVTGTVSISSFAPETNLNS